MSSLLIFWRAASVSVMIILTQCKVTQCKVTYYNFTQLKTHPLASARRLRSVLLLKNLKNWRCVNMLLFSLVTDRKHISSTKYYITYIIYTKYNKYNITCILVVFRYVFGFHLKHCASDQNAFTFVKFTTQLFSRADESLTEETRLLLF